jgi:hypothetical protein
MIHTSYRVFEAGSEGCYIKPDTGDKREDMRTVAHVGYGNPTQGREIARLFAASARLLMAAKSLENWLNAPQSDLSNRAIVVDCRSELRVAIIEAESGAR